MTYSGGGQRRYDIQVIRTFESWVALVRQTHGEDDAKCASPSTMAAFTGICRTMQLLHQVLLSIRLINVTQICGDPDYKSFK